MLTLRFPRRSAQVRAAHPYFGQRDATRARRLSALTLLPFLGMALLIGAVSGLDVPILLLLVTGVLFALVATFAIPSNGYLQVMFVVTFLIQGSLLYFAGLHAATWIATGMAAMFLFRLLLDCALVRRHRRQPDYPENGRALLIACGAYFLCYGASIAMTRPPLAQLVSAAKSNLPMYAVLGSFFFFRWPLTQIERLWKLAVFIMLVQLPVTLYQHFFVSSLRHNGFDSVVGTFGGTPLAGGLSSIMVLFVVGAMAWVASRWHHGALSGRRALLWCMAGFAAILLGEVKAAFIWLPICLLFVLRKRVLRNVMAFAMYGILSAALLSVIYVAYDQMYWTDAHARSRQEQEKADNYFFDVNNVDYSTGEISRGASLAFWYNDRDAVLPQRLLGYGPGASKSAGALGGGGVIAQRFQPLAVDATAAAVLLWDEGILGALSYASILIAGLWTARQALRRPDLTPAARAVLDTSTGILLVYVTLLIYNRTQLDEPTSELLLMFCLGGIAQCARYRPIAVAAVPESRARISAMPTATPPLHPTADAAA